MAENFTKFIISLAEDLQLLRKFQSNPKEIMKEAGLTQAEQAILSSRDHVMVREAIVSDLGLSNAESAEGVTVVIWTYTRVHSPDLIKGNFSDLSNKLKGES